MPAKKIKRVTNPRKRTAEEAAEDCRLRELVEKDKAEIVAEGIAERKRRRSAAE
jgi:hypothetical protein